VSTVGEMESVVGAEFVLGADVDTELAWFRKCRRMFELTLNARPQEGWGQRKAKSKHEIRQFGEGSLIPRRRNAIH
jgi:hypothetical protein